LISSVTFGGIISFTEDPSEAPEICDGSDDGPIDGVEIIGVPEATFGSELANLEDSGGTATSTAVPASDLPVDVGCKLCMDPVDGGGGAVTSKVGTDRAPGADDAKPPWTLGEVTTLSGLVKLTSGPGSVPASFWYKSSGVDDRALDASLEATADMTGVNGDS
jgi:hypothetical protein